MKELEFDKPESGEDTSSTLPASSPPEEEVVVPVKKKQSVLAKQFGKDALISLDGNVMTADGKSYTSQYFQFLEIGHRDNYGDISFTPEEADKIRARLANLTTGSAAAIPLICGGKSKCPFAVKCPFVRMDEERVAVYGPDVERVTPVGRECLVEINLLNQWTRLFVEQFGIEDSNLIQLGMCRDLAETELLLWRVKVNLSKIENAELVQEVTVGVDKEGNVLTRQEVNAHHDIKERLENRKTKLIKLMVGDPEGQWKREAGLKLRSDTDPSSRSAQLAGDINTAIRAVEQKLLEIKEEAGQIIEVTPAEPDTLSPEAIFEEAAKE